ncbi:hypothetical protein L596_023931 [Steinernema carpocapsae]|uniref:Uncharacterized protein n=1 Tax=Steinernema carpocapsae TaxID=34508 RepID=A0A4U5MFW6_STECR|nr:hypothetical protein L596_023931 [Steinernema carpocapsae]
MGSAAIRLFRALWPFLVFLALLFPLVCFYHSERLLDSEICYGKRFLFSRNASVPVVTLKVERETKKTANSSLKTSLATQRPTFENPATLANPLALLKSLKKTTTQPYKRPFQSRREKLLNCKPSSFDFLKASGGPKSVNEAQQRLLTLACIRRNSLIEYIQARRNNESFVCPSWIVDQLKAIDKEARTALYPPFLTAKDWGSQKAAERPWFSSSWLHPETLTELNYFIDENKHSRLRDIDPNCKEADNHKKTWGISRRSRSVKLTEPNAVCTEGILLEAGVFSVAVVSFLASLFLVYKRYKDHYVNYKPSGYVATVVRRNEEPPTYEMVMESANPYRKDPRIRLL